jgi:hypothetical protein
VPPPGWHLDRQRFDRKARLLEGVEALLRPRDVLENRHGKTSGVNSDHGRVMYHGDLRKPLRRTHPRSRPDPRPGALPLDE